MTHASANTSYILTLSCPNRIGIVHAVTGFLFERSCNITDSAQFDDPDTGKFFMRVAFATTNKPVKLADLQASFDKVADLFQMDWAVYDQGQPTKVMILVSHFDHCLVDLIYRKTKNELKMDIVDIVSNHRDSSQIATQHDIPFHYLPVSRETKKAQEAKLLELLHKTKTELIILARYMQIFSDEMCEALPCPAINIHHSFLPSFKGARPHQQAYVRGVKLIGATAHYVTPVLDEGPIIEQGIERVTHSLSTESLIAVGRDTERRVLARAVKLQLEKRVLLNGKKTVVFG